MYYDADETNTRTFSLLALHFGGRGGGGGSDCILDVLRLGNNTARVASATVKEGADGRLGDSHVDAALLGNFVT